MENVIDVVNFEMPSLLEDTAIPKNKSARASIQKNTRLQRLETFKRMDQRNRMLIDPLATGKESLVTETRLAKAVGSYRAKGKLDSQLTVVELARRLKCADSAVYAYFEKHEETLEEFLERIR